MPSSAPAIEALTTGVLRLAPDLSLAYANPAAGDLLGTGLKLGLPLSITLPDAVGLHAAIDDARREGQGLTARELAVPLPGAKPITLDATLTPLDDGSLLLEVVALDRHRQIALEFVQTFGENLLLRQLLPEMPHFFMGRRLSANSRLGA